MPVYTLRLTDTQYKLLRKQAKKAGRSVQKEIEHRLFEAVAPGPKATSTPRGASAVGNDADTGATTDGEEDPDGTAAASSSSPCGFAARHHLYSPSKPCPRCGYPQKGAV